MILLGVFLQLIQPHKVVEDPVIFYFVWMHFLAAPLAMLLYKLIHLFAPFCTLCSLEISLSLFRNDFFPFIYLFNKASISFVSFDVPMSTLEFRDSHPSFGS